MKVGTQVNVVGPDYNGRQTNLGQIFTITQDRTDGYFSADGYPWFHQDSLLDISTLIINNNMTKLTEAFSLAFKSEPEKSFRKAGITNGDDLLTDDGTKVFLGWLLNQNKAQFKTDVVDGILKELETK